MRNAKLILLAIAIVALAPCLITCLYALPFADDFCFGWTAGEHISFTAKFLKQYLHWNGRYTSDVLVNLHPLAIGSLFWYQLVCAVSILATPLVFYFFTRLWLPGKLNALLIALLISLFYIAYLPNLTDGVYWYIGLVNYHWGALLFIMQLTVLTALLRQDRLSVLQLLLSLVLLILSVGFNEVGAALIPVYYFGAVVYVRVVYPQGTTNKSRVLLTHFMVGVAASAFVIFSPGNFTRENVFPERFNLVHSVVFAALQTGRFVGGWILSVPFIALAVLVVTNAGKVQSRLSQVHFSMYTLMLLFTVFMAAFLPYMATGILGQHRTMNYVFPFFIILGIAVLWSVSVRYKLYQKLNVVGGAGISSALIIVAILGMVFSSNQRNMISDLSSNSLANYKGDFFKRQAEILKNPEKAIAPLPQVPNTFVIVDVDSARPWIAKCMQKYYMETGLVVR